MLGKGAVMLMKGSSLGVVGLCLVMTVASCSQRPENIEAADIGQGAYAQMNCRQLAERQLHFNQRLTDLSAAQNRAATGDAWGVFLLGLPVSRMSGGDRATEISVTRGHLNEIAREQQRKNC